MDTLERLKGIYAEFYSAMEQVRAEEQGLRGALNVFVSGPRSRNACSVRFNEAVQAALSEPQAREQAAEIVDFILLEGWAHREPPAVGLMLTAMHGYLAELLPFVSEEKKQGLLAWYEKNYPRRDRTPVMEKFKKALSAGQ